MPCVTAPASAREAWRLRVTGLVQGVGFRPFVHRLALRHQLGGTVRNTAGDVEIRVEGARDSFDAFRRALEAEAPSLARIESVAVAQDVVEECEGFTILPSADQPGRRQPVSPDVAICAACEKELFDPADRRYRYPFITCTDCGPRFTVIHAMPYDRERTSMAPFAQCPACLGEYDGPGNRRHHSETNSCHTCGPRLWYRTSDNRTVDGADAAIRAAAQLVLGGGILALRGLGGFHLAADAASELTVRRLRSRKHRDAKPFAVMVRTLEDARTLALVSDAEAALLSSAERPIVLLSLRPDAGLAPSVAPGLGMVGLMLAGTPLHHLLLDECNRPLVMTSGNLSDEPIAIGNREAVRRLASIADGYLLHDREIVARYDDSIMRVVAGQRVLMRRARGYAPMPLRLPVPSPRPLVAVGPHLKNTFTLVAGDQAYVSQHIGDLDSLETLDHFQASLETFRRLFRIEPEIAVRDLHEGYLSTRIAGELGLERVLTVQHHHAHIAAVMAEHGVTGPVLGVAMDGTGAGDDGTSWGAEFLVADLLEYRRVGHFRSAPMPGGDAASRAPWRAALGYLSLQPGNAQHFAAAFDGIDAEQIRVARRQIERRLNAPMASSLGRLFDAAAAVLGVRRHASYEGQAATELEALAARRPARERHCAITEEGSQLVLDPVPLLAALGARRLRGENQADLAAEFHASVARAMEVMVRRLADAERLGTVVLSGGSFQNARLLESMLTRLAEPGFRVLAPRLLPPNDGAISYGQAAVAAARLSAGWT
jgi:hydrogenase maturation protein HypF